LPRGAGADADAELAEAVSLLEGIVREFPGQTWYRRDLAWALRVRGDRHAASGQDEPAEADLTEARRLMTALVELSPEDRAFPGDLGRIETSLGRLRLRQKRGDEARALFKSALARLEKSCKDRADNRSERASRDAASAALSEADAAGPSGSVAPE
jgi:hypothetical protein